MNLMALIAELGPWNWLILAAVLFTLEMFAPGIFLLWFGLAAALVGAIALSVPIAWQFQFVAFGVFSVISLLLARRFVLNKDKESDRPLLNKRAMQHVGRSYVLVEEISNGRGKVKIGDSLWPVEGPDMPAGQTVTVTGANGVTLLVEEKAA